MLAQSQDTWLFSAMTLLSCMALGKSLSSPRSQFPQIFSERVRLDGLQGPFSVLKSCPVGKATAKGPSLIRVLEGLVSRLLKLEKKESSKFHAAQSLAQDQA